MELITDLKAIRKEIGLRLEGSSLYPNLNLDAYKRGNRLTQTGGRLQFLGVGNRGDGVDVLLGVVEVGDREGRHMGLQEKGKAPEQGRLRGGYKPRCIS